MRRLQAQYQDRLAKGVIPVSDAHRAIAAYRDVRAAVCGCIAVPFLPDEGTRFVAKLLFDRTGRVSSEHPLTCLDIVTVWAMFVQFISKNYKPLHPSLFTMSEEHFDPEFLRQFRAGATELDCVHPFVFTFKYGSSSCSRAVRAFATATAV